MKSKVDEVQIEKLREQLRSMSDEDFKRTLKAFVQELEKRFASGVRAGEIENLGVLQEILHELSGAGL